MACLMLERLSVDYGKNVNLVLDHTRKPADRYRGVQAIGLSKVSALPVPSLLARSICVWHAVHGVRTRHAAHIKLSFMHVF